MAKWIYMIFIYKKNKYIISNLILLILSKIVMEAINGWN